MSVPRSVVVGFGIVVGVWMATGAETQGTHEIQALHLDSSPEGVAVQIQTSLPVPSFRCSLAAPPSHDVVLEVPEAASRLQSHYDLDGNLIREARIEAGIGPSGVRIRFIVGEGRLSGVELTTQGLVLRFAPASAADGATPDTSEYRIGIGDKLDINVFGHEDLNRIVDVRTDGGIAYPLIGDLHVVNKTPSEVDSEITKALGKDYIVDPQVSVEVKESQSRWVTILGEIHTPGKYLLKRNMRVVDLLAEAGGPTKDAGPSIVITHRERPGEDPRQITLERDRLFASDSNEANLALAPGDIVSLAEKEVFYIRGEVVKPGPYFLEKGMTVLKAITLASGLSQFANRKDVVILRSQGNRIQEKLKVNLKAIEDGRQPDIFLLPNDLIIVPRRIF